MKLSGDGGEVRAADRLAALTNRHPGDSHRFVFLSSKRLS
jgi:hypothetical protein